MIQGIIKVNVEPFSAPVPRLSERLPKATKIRNLPIADFLPMGLGILIEDYEVTHHIGGQ